MVAAREIHAEAEGRDSNPQVDISPEIWLIDLSPTTTSTTKVRRKDLPSVGWLCLTVPNAVPAWST
jgi:hypothetical protein